MTVELRKKKNPHYKMSLSFFFLGYLHKSTAKRRPNFTSRVVYRENIIAKAEKKSPFNLLNYNHICIVPAYRADLANDEVTTTEYCILRSIIINYTYLFINAFGKSIKSYMHYV